MTVSSEFSLIEITFIYVHFVEKVYIYIYSFNTHNEDTMTNIYKYFHSMSFFSVHFYWVFSFNTANMRRPYTLMNLFCNSLKWFLFSQHHSFNIAVLLLATIKLLDNYLYLFSRYISAQLLEMSKHIIYVCILWLHSLFSRRVKFSGLGLIRLTCSSVNHSKCVFWCVYQILYFAHQGLI